MDVDSGIDYADVQVWFIMTNQIHGNEIWFWYKLEKKTKEHGCAKNFLQVLAINSNRSNVSHSCVNMKQVIGDFERPNGHWMSENGHVFLCDLKKVFYKLKKISQYMGTKIG